MSQNRFLSGPSEEWDFAGGKYLGVWSLVMLLRQSVEAYRPWLATGESHRSSQFLYLGVI